WFGQRVIDGPLVRLRDWLAEALAGVRGLDQQERQLVELVGAGGEPGLHEREEQHRVIAERDPLDDLDPRDRSRLRGVPALMLDPVAQALLVEALAQLRDRDLDRLSHPDRPSPALPRRAGTRKSPGGRASAGREARRCGGSASGRTARPGSGP